MTQWTLTDFIHSKRMFFTTIQNRWLEIQQTEKVTFIENMYVIHIRQCIRKLENYLSTQTISDFNNKAELTTEMRKVTDISSRMILLGT